MMNLGRCVRNTPGKASVQMEDYISLQTIVNVHVASAVSTLINFMLSCFETLLQHNWYCSLFVHDKMSWNLMGVRNKNKQKQTGIFKYFF